MERQKNDHIWDLSIKSFHNSLSDTEKIELEQAKLNPQTKDEFERAEKIQRKIANSYLLQQIDKGKRWEQIYRQISFSSYLRKQALGFSKYAAIFIFALCVGLLIPHFIKQEDAGTNKVEIEWGQMGKITLSDNTKVWLNAGTVLEYPNTFTPKERIVHLTGEAQFKVTHNDYKPFEVVTKAGIVKVYGTTFNVTAYDNDPDITVTLIEGKVAVENTKGQQLAILKPSEQIKINKLNGKTSIKNVDTSFYTSWIDGKISLDETKLSDLAPILRRLYNVDIQLIGEGVGEIQVSGTISRSKPIDLFFKVLGRMYGVKYEIKPNKDGRDEILIYKK
nr:FecR domain-containing protein [uncultured Draconibacterium sp.]